MGHVKSFKGREMVEKQEIDKGKTRREIGIGLSVVVGVI